MCLLLVSRHFHRSDRDPLIRTFEAAWHERKPAVTACRAPDSLILFAIPGRPRATPIASPQTRCVEGMGRKKFRWRRKFALLARPIFENAREKNSRSRPPDRPTPKNLKNTAALSRLPCVPCVIYFDADVRLAK